MFLFQWIYLYSVSIPDFDNRKSNSKKTKWEDLWDLFLSRTLVFNCRRRKSEDVTSVCSYGSVLSLKRNFYITQRDNRSPSGLLSFDQRREKSGPLRVWKFGHTSTVAMVKQKTVSTCGLVGIAGNHHQGQSRVNMCQTWGKDKVQQYHDGRETRLRNHYLPFSKQNSVSTNDGSFRNFSSRVLILRAV